MFVSIQLLQIQNIWRYSNMSLAKTTLKATKHIFLLCILFSLFTLLPLLACQDEWLKSDTTSNNSKSSSDEFVWDTELEGKVDIQGLIVDYLGNPIANAHVSAGSDEMNTNAQGMFALGKMTKEENVITIKHNDYISSAVVHHLAVENSAESLVVSLLPLGDRTKLNILSGGTAKGARGAEAIFPGNALANTSGAALTEDVEIAITPIDPYRDEELSATPGNFTAVVDGTTVMLESLGLMDISVVNPNTLEQPLNLADGVSIEIRIPASEGLKDFIKIVPLWRFDYSIAQWVLEGEATLDDVSKTYIASISKLGLWNISFFYKSTCITGRLTDSNGTAYKYRALDVFGFDCFTKVTVRTDENGRFLAPAKVDSDVVVRPHAWFSEGWPPSLMLLRADEMRVRSGTTIIDYLNDMGTSVTCLDIGNIVGTVIPYNGAVIDGDYAVFNDNDIAAIKNIERINGSLKINKTNITSIILPKLKQISGNLDMDDNEFLVDVQFPGLISVGTLRLRKNPILSDLSGFSSLVSIGILDIVGKSAFANFKDLSYLNSVGSILIYSNNGLLNLEGLERVRKLGFLQILDSLSLRSLSGLCNLEHIESLLSIENNPDLCNLTGLDKLQEVGLNVYIAHNVSLESLAGLESLSYLGVESNSYDIMKSHYSIYGNAKLPNCEAHRILQGITFDKPEYRKICIYQNKTDSCEEFVCD